MLCVILFCSIYHVKAFSLFDAQFLLELNKPIILKGAELENILNPDPAGGVYTTMTNEFENQKNVREESLYFAPQERCQADYARCSSSILSTNGLLVCAMVNRKRKEFLSICDLYLMICNYDTAEPNSTDFGDEKTLDFQVVNYGSCDYPPAPQIFVYDNH